ncbi:MAG: Glycosyl transferase group 1 [Microgenomates group bacterium GW2011_GWA2_47_8]|nr:MAG: Glycosyl transferase group 1 [Microgenomates group bacterium GW2011_GWA2_47_8]
MDILFLSWKDLKNPDVGGAEIIVYELAKRLAANGHHVMWFTRRFSGSKEHDAYDGVNIIRRGGKFSVYWEAYRYYRSLVRKPDKVIDCVNTLCWQTPLYVPVGNRVMLVNQLAKEVFFYELPFPFSWFTYVFERFEYLTYKDTQVLCYSTSTKIDLATFGIRERNVHVFPLGIDHLRYKPGKKSQNPLFIFVARLTRMKRPDLCIRAMRLVVDTYPKAKLAILGYGPMEQKQLKLIQMLNLEANVSLVNKDTLFFAKNTKDKKVWFMQQAWALLLPSVKEGWGMVVTEAAACGTPAIVTDVSGLRDSVVAGKTGLVISSDPTAEELAGAMRRIIKDKKFSDGLAIEARGRSRQFTWEKSYAAFVKFLES